MGLLAPDRSREKVLMILSLTELDPTLVREKSRRGRIPFSYEFFMNSVLESPSDQWCWATTRVRQLGWGWAAQKWKRGKGKEEAGQAGLSF
jgi:hypothetical protein